MENHKILTFTCCCKDLVKSSFKSRIEYVTYHQIIRLQLIGCLIVMIYLQRVFTRSFYSRRMAPTVLPSSNGALPPFIGPTLIGTSFASYKRAWWRRVAPCLAFLAAFCTAMAVLLVWSEAAALR